MSTAQQSIDWGTRSSARRASLRDEEVVVDNFAGGGGASLGIEQAIGRAVDVAINHDPMAVAMHEANHPATMHYSEDVWAVDPLAVTRGRRVGLAWFSPDCKHFSRAKGGRPVEKKIRGLAWVVVKWAKAVQPRVICLENVREFEQWGPLRADNTPCPDRKGLTFRQFVGRLKALGYAVEWRTLNAADFGAPTHRRRLFLVARCDEQPIAWPEPTHGPGRGEKYRTAAECIDWSIPCPSIFERARPLAEKTLRRVAMGIKRYVLDNPQPFIVRVNHGRDEFRGQSMDQPLGTVTGHHGYGVVSPAVVRIGHYGGNGDYSHGVDEPLRTQQSKAQDLLIAPTLVHYHDEKTPADVRASNVGDPLPVQTTENRFALVTGFLAQYFGGIVGKDLREPTPTVTAWDHNAIAAASLIHLNHGEKQWSGVDEPLRSVTAGGNHAGLVYAFLTKYFGTAIGSSLLEPSPTQTGKHRFGLVTVTVLGELYVIVDIGLRMLQPHELAKAQGFPDDYVWLGSKADQVRMIGNSVCPVMARVLAAANCPELRAPKRKARA